MTSLAVSPATHLNVYTCPIQGEILGEATLPWQYDQDSLLNGVFIHPEALPGGNIPELNQGKNLVHEVSKNICFHLLKQVVHNRFFIKYSLAHAQLNLKPPLHKAISSCNLCRNILLY